MEIIIFRRPALLTQLLTTVASSRFYLTIVVMLFVQRGFTQVIDAAQCTVNNHLIVTGKAGVLRISKRTDIDSITSRYKDQFQQSVNKPVVSFGYDSSEYWFRMIIRNDSSHSRELMLLMSPVGMREGRLYQKNDSGWMLAGRNGMRIPFRDRPYQYAHYVFPLSIAARSIDTLYLHMDAAHAFKSYGFALLHPQGLAMFRNRAYFSFGIITGLLTLFFLFNLYLYFALKEKVHAWYALYIALLIVIVIKNDQLDQEFFAGDSELMYRLTPILGIGAMAIAVLMHVVLLILPHIRLNKTLHRVTSAIQANALVSGIMHSIAFNLKPEPSIEMLFFNWAKYSTILAIVAIIGLCLYSAVKGRRTGLFILAGLVVFLIGALQRLLFENTAVQLFPPSIFHIGMVIETLIISFILIYRYRTDREEKKQYQREKEELKNNFEKLMLQSKYEIQEQTLKNISQEIHDNIGQVLSLAKLNISKLKLYDKAQWDSSIEDSSDLLNKAIVDLRDLSKSLNTDYILQKGLIRSLEYELELLRKIAGIQADLIIAGNEYKIEPQKELVIFRICQEAFNNIIKHANATFVSVKITYAKELLISIQDNGKGFNNETNIKSNGSNGQGLMNLQRRSQLLGGSCEIHSNNQGTEVRITLNKEELTPTTIEL